MGKLDLKYFNESEYVIAFFDCYIKYKKEDKQIFLEMLKYLMQHIVV